MWSRFPAMEPTVFRKSFWQNWKHVFLGTGAPNCLTLMFAGGIGDAKDRGLNRLGHEGLLKRVIGGHYGLIPKIEKLARENRVEAYNFPEGVITHLYRNIAAGKRGALSRIGLETFVDPRLEGAKVNKAAKEDLVELLTLNGEEALYFSAPPVNIALIRGTTADPDGNISLEKESLNLENLSLAMAAHNSGGIVICQVERVALQNSIDARDVRVPGFIVDCVVVAEPEYHMQNYNEQYNPALSGEIRVPLETLPPLPLDEKKVILRRGRYGIDTRWLSSTLESVWRPVWGTSPMRRRSRTRSCLPSTLVYTVAFLLPGMDSVRH